MSQVVNFWTEKLTLLRLKLKSMLTQFLQYNFQPSEVLWDVLAEDNDVV